MEAEPEVVPTRKASQSGESGKGAGSPSGGGTGISQAPPMLPFLPFPSGISGETLSSDASVSGLSAMSDLSGSSSNTVTQSQTRFPGPGQAQQSFLFPASPMANEPRSVFEDDAEDGRAAFPTSASNHTQNSLSTSTNASTATDTPIQPGKEGKLLRTMRSFKLSLKGQKAPKLPLPEAPPVPVVPSLPPQLTLKLGKGAGLVDGLSNEEQKAKDEEQRVRDERAFKIAEMFKPESGAVGQTSSVYTTNSHSESGHAPTVQSDIGHPVTSRVVSQGSEVGQGPYSDLGHAPIRVAGGGGNGGFWSSNVGKERKVKGTGTATKTKPVVRRMSVDTLHGVAEGETAKATERARTGTVGTRRGHGRKPSKSGDFSGVGWEKGSSRPPVPGTVATEPTATKPAAAAAKSAVSKSSAAQESKSADPLSPKLSFESDSRHSLERSGFGARGEHDEMRALDVQHQLQSFVASMRGTGGEDAEEDAGGSLEGGFSRSSEEAYNYGYGRQSEESYDRARNDLRARPRGDDSDTLRSSGEYDPDPFRAFVGQTRALEAASAAGGKLPRPESEALPHQVIIPTYQIPKEVGQLGKAPVAPVPRRNIPPTAFRSPESELPSGLVRMSSISARPSIVVAEPADQPMAADLTDEQPARDDAAEDAKDANKGERSEGHARTESVESELGLGYSGFDFARSAVANDEPPASDEWVVPSPSWAPLDLKRTRTPDPREGQTGQQYLDVRMDNSARQRASGLSIPRSVTPDSPMPPSRRMSPLVPARPLATSRSTTPLGPSRSVTPLMIPSRSVTPLGPTRSATTPVITRSITPQTQPPKGPLPPQPRQQLQLQQRNSPSPPISRRTLPVRTSSISSVSSGDQSLGHGAAGSSVHSPASRAGSVSRVVQAAPIPRSVTSTPLPRAPIPRSTSTTPTPRVRAPTPDEESEPLRHEHFSRFLAPEAIPTAQKRGRVSPFPARPLRNASDSRERTGPAEARIGSAVGWQEDPDQQEASQSQREKYPGGAEKYGADGLMQVPRVRFIGVRSSNGSSQADWQGRMEDMRKAGPPTRADSWYDYGEDNRPVSWQSEQGLPYDSPRDSVYEDNQEYDPGARYSAYEDEAREDDARAPVPTIQSPEEDPSPPDTRYPGWAVDATTPASRASTFTVASAYDDDIPPVPNTRKLAAAVRGMGQNSWAEGRI